MAGGCGCGDSAAQAGQLWEPVFGDGTVGKATTKQAATAAAAERGGYIREAAK